MKVVVVGAGAMDSVRTGLLADCGHEVLATSDRLELVDAINDDGWRMEADLTASSKGTITPLVKIFDEDL